MLDGIDLTRKLKKAEYKAAKKECELRLGELQRRCTELGIPVIVVFEGWGASGKGTLINELILPLDPRGFKVWSTLAPNEEERLRPFLWRFWTRTPPRGRWAIFDRSWNRRVLHDRFRGEVEDDTLQQAYRDIRCFERQLASDGNVIIKFFLHVSRKVQKKRFKKLQKNEATAWRVCDYDLKQNQEYDDYLAIAEEMLARTESDFAPWTVVESHDYRFGAIKVFRTVIQVLEQRIAEVEAKQEPEIIHSVDLELPAELSTSCLDGVDLSQTLDRDTYKKLLKQRQKRLLFLEHELYVRRIPLVLVYEGWDAAGKGGNIKRLTANLDPRGYEVIPVAAPNDVERQHHYLWRFWRYLPKAGHITIFDRSWYGRVMVERIEGFCSEREWKRAFREINEMEEHLVHYGTILLKFWIHIDQDEQLARFKAREENPAKQWKITEEDWRNREKWEPYKQAVDEMIMRTSSPQAPWIVVESNCKRFARIKAMDEVIAAIEARL